MMIVTPSQLYCFDIVGKIVGRTEIRIYTITDVEGVILRPGLPGMSNSAGRYCLRGAAIVSA